MQDTINLDKVKKHSKVLVTSALPYVNNVPHLGTMVCIISADVYTRFLRNKGEEVMSVLGTDEHGTTTETIAKKMGLTPKEAVEHFYKIHKQVYDWFNCSFDCFGRTSSPENREITQEIFLKLKENGSVTEKVIEQMYDEEAKKFLSDRFIEGTCPHCNYEEARGDQCESCGRLLNPNELINPISKLTKSKPVVKSTKHFFIKLNTFQLKLEEFINQRKSSWSENAVATTKAWLKEGLRERAITRDLEWGIPVPVEGYEKKVFYVWFDAPIGYIGITKACRKDWHDWWHNPRNVNLVQFMGKDNIPFHSILFPAALIGTWDNYTTIDILNANEYLNYEDSKFSKSRGIGVFGDNIQEIDVPSDAWRYYLMINRPEKTDTKFTWGDFQEKVNADLVGNLGNLINRTLTFIKKFNESKITQINEPNPFEYKKELVNILRAYDKIELKNALKHIMALSKLGNQFFQEREPWKLIKENPVLANSTLVSLFNLIKDLSILIHPIMPKIAQDIQSQLNIESGFSLNRLNVDFENHTIGEPKVLFRKIEDDELKKYKEKFSGSQEKKEENNLEKLDLRVAKITSVKKHPDAEKLYIEELDCGNGEKRTIVSGLVPYYSPEELIGKNIVLVYNLKPAKLRGVLSQGMLLAVGEKENVGVLHLPSGAPGDKLTVEGVISNPSKELTIDEFFSVSLHAKDKFVYADSKKLLANTSILIDKDLSGKIK